MVFLFVLVSFSFSSPQISLSLSVSLPSILSSSSSSSSFFFFFFLFPDHYFSASYFFSSSFFLLSSSSFFFVVLPRQNPMVSFFRSSKLLVGRGSLASDGAMWDQQCLQAVGQFFGCVVCGLGFQVDLKPIWD